MRRANAAASLLVLPTLHVSQAPQVTAVDITVVQTLSREASSLHKGAQPRITGAGKTLSRSQKMALGIFTTAPPSLFLVLSNGKALI